MTDHHRRPSAKLLLQDLAGVEVAEAGQVINLWTFPNASSSAARWVPHTAARLAPTAGSRDNCPAAALDSSSPTPPDRCLQTRHPLMVRHESDKRLGLASNLYARITGILRAVAIQDVELNHPPGNLEADVAGVVVRRTGRTRL